MSSTSNIYVSVANTATTEITVKKSRFICNICHAESEAAAAEFIEKVVDFLNIVMAVEKKFIIEQAI